MCVGHIKRGCVVAPNICGWINSQGHVSRSVRLRVKPHPHAFLFLYVFLGLAVGFYSTSNRMLSPTNFPSDAPKAVKSTPERVVMDQLERAALKCEFAGNPKPEITWFRSHDQETQIGVGDFLEIAELSSSHAGEYICLAESMLGKARSSVTLAVRGPPVITSQTGKSQEPFLKRFIV